MGNPLCSFFVFLLLYTLHRGVVLKHSDKKVVSVSARNMSHESFLVHYFIYNTILYLLSHLSAFAKLHHLFNVANAILIKPIETNPILSNMASLDNKEGFRRSAFKRIIGECL